MDVGIYNVPKEAMVDLEKWAAIVIEKWQFNLIKRRVRHSGELFNSFLAQITADAEGNSAMISFAFQYYIRMVDMGVGNGVKYGDVADLADSRRLEGRNTGNRRRPKAVFLKTFYSQVYRLSELLAEQYAQQGAHAVAFMDE